VIKLLFLISVYQLCFIRAFKLLVHTSPSHKHFRQSLDMPFKVTQGLDFGTNRKRVYGFILVRNSNLGPILHRFGDIAGFLLSRVQILPQFWGCSHCTRWPMLGLARAEALSFSAVKLFSKNSNRCEKHTSRSRTDRRTTYCDITALCLASRGKKFRTSVNTLLSCDKNSILTRCLYTTGRK